MGLSVLMRFCSSVVQNDDRWLVIIGFSAQRSYNNPIRWQLQMSKPRLNVGIVGYGFMGRTHSNSFRRVPNFFDVPYVVVLKAACGRNRARTEAFQQAWGYESIETDWRKLVERRDIDVIDIASPNDTHAEVAIASAQAGKTILCEKPFGRNGTESKAIVEAAEKANVPNMVWYNSRRVPAVTLAKELVSEGRLGRVFHYRAKFLQAGRDYGVWMFKLRGVVSRETCWRTVSILPCG